MRAARPSSHWQRPARFPWPLFCSSSAPARHLHVLQRSRDSSLPPSILSVPAPQPPGRRATAAVPSQPPPAPAPAASATTEPPAEAAANPVPPTAATTEPPAETAANRSHPPPRTRSRPPLLSRPARRSRPGACPSRSPARAPSRYRERLGACRRGRQVLLQRRAAARRDPQCGCHRLVQLEGRRCGRSRGLWNGQPVAALGPKGRRGTSSSRPTASISSLLASNARASRRRALSRSRFSSRSAQ